MNKIVAGILVAFIATLTYGQGLIRIKNFNTSPLMTESSDGIWQYWERNIPNDEDKDSTMKGYPDSLFVVVPGYPNHGDVYTPDFELKAKMLWHNDTVFFLFQRLDDIYVSGYDNIGNPDATISEGLDNRDATKIYFYLSGDSLRVRTDTVSFTDTIAWLQFAWKSDDVQACLPGGEIVSTKEDFHTQIIQWCEGAYCYAKLSIAIGEIAPYITSTINTDIQEKGFSLIGFMLEATENDKETGQAPYSVQTRVFWEKNFDSTAMNHLSKWGWMVFLHDTNNIYSTPVKTLFANFANIYPNPARDAIYISLDEFATQTNYSIFDIMGRMVMNGKIENQSERIDVSGLYSGTYLLVLRNNLGGIMNRKIAILP